MAWIFATGCAFGLVPILAGLVVTVRVLVPRSSLLLRENWAIPRKTIPGPERYSNG